MSNTLQIDKIHLTAKAPNGDTLAVATFTNGNCGVTRDGQPIPGHEWPARQVAECTAALARLAELSD